ncbi:hypothetical protein WJX84_011600 [Apatococcus fuscideae]|uniref:Uncharacterized protein n=1 Tax=Apatococcus fuscideae TaxID=2026836 RepID=A0AAW1TAY4_9CHLO
MGNDNSHLRSYGEHYAHTPVPQNQSRWMGCLGCLNDPTTKNGASNSESYSPNNGTFSTRQVRKLLQQDLGQREEDKQSFLNPLQRLRASHAHHSRNVSEPGLPSLSDEDILQAAPCDAEKLSIRANPLKSITPPASPTSETTK